jgi:AcrR family transcriptional regulator
MAKEMDAAARILDAASRVVVSGGFDAMTLRSLAEAAEMSESAVLLQFTSLDDALLLMINREFTRIYMAIADHVERDPRGGLLSRIYFYTLAAIYERPLARALYTSDPHALNVLMRRANGLGYIPGVGISAELIEQMQIVGVVRRDVDSHMIAHMITIFSAGLALTAPHGDLDLIIRGVTDIIARAVDAHVEDTSAGKAAFFQWATSL